MVTVAEQLTGVRRVRQVSIPAPESEEEIKKRLAAAATSLKAKKILELSASIEKFRRLKSEAENKNLDEDVATYSREINALFLTRLRLKKGLIGLSDIKLSVGSLTTAAALRQEARRQAITEFPTEQLGRKVLREQKITTKEAQQLSPQLRKSLGLQIEMPKQTPTKIIQAPKKEIPKVSFTPQGFMETPVVSIAPPRFDTRQFKEAGVPGFASATIQSFKIFGTDILKGFGLKKGEIINPLSTFEGRGVAKADQPFLNPLPSIKQQKTIPEIFGIPSTSLQTFITKSVRIVPTGKTRGEVKAERELGAGIPKELIDLTPKAREGAIADITSKRLQNIYQPQLETSIETIRSQFQTKIKQGSPFEQTEEQYRAAVKAETEKFNVRLQEDFSKMLPQKISSLKETEASVLSDRSLRDLGKTSGDYIKKYTQRGAFVLGAAAAGQSPIAATGLGAYFTGISTKEFGTGILGKGLTPTQRATHLGLGTLQAGFGFLSVRAALGPQTTTITGVGGEKVKIPSNLLERQFYREQLKDLSKARLGLTGMKQKISPGFIETRLQGFQYSAPARRDVDIILRSFPKGEATGRFGTETTIKSIFGQKIVIPENFAFSTFGLPAVEKGYIGIGGRNTGQIATKSVAFVRVSELGKSTFRQFKTFGFSTEEKTGIKFAAGLVQKEKGFIKTGIFGARAIEGIRISGKPYLIGAGSRGTKTIFIPKTFGGKITTTGFIPKSTEQISGFTFKQIIQRGQGAISTKGGLGPLLQLPKQSLQQATEQSLKSSIGVLGVTPKLTTTQIGISKSILAGPGAIAAMLQIPSQYRATGLYEKSATLSIVASGLTQKQIVKQESRLKTGFMSGLASFSASALSQSQATSQLSAQESGLTQLQEEIFAPTIVPPITSLPGFEFPRTFTGFDIPGFRFKGGRARRKRKVRGIAKRKTPIKPSFTATTLDLRGSLPKRVSIGKIDIGILPTQLRRIPIKRKKIKKKKTKKKGKKTSRKSKGLFNFEIPEFKLNF